MGVSSLRNKQIVTVIHARTTGIVFAVMLLLVALLISGVNSANVSAATPDAPEYLGGADASGTANSGTTSANLGNGTYDRNIIVEGNYAYVSKPGSSSDCATVREGCEFQIYDVTNKSAPVLVAGVDGGGAINSGTENSGFQSLAVSNGYAYLVKPGNATNCNSSNKIGCEIHIYNVTNPLSPTFVAGIDASGAINSGTVANNVFASYVNGNYLYVGKISSAVSCSNANDKSGCEVQIYNISNPASPTFVAGIDAGGAVNSGSVANTVNNITGFGNHIIFSRTPSTTDCADINNKSGCEIGIYNIADPLIPTGVTNVDSSGTANSGTAAEQINSLHTDGTTLAVGKSQTTSNCSSPENCEIQLYDVSVPSLITFRSGIDASGAINSGTASAPVMSVYIDDNYLYTAANASVNNCNDNTNRIGCEIKIFDISSPASPSYVSGIDASGSINQGTASVATYSVLVDEGKLYALSAGSATNCASGDKSGCELKIFSVAVDIPWEGYGDSEDPYQITNCEQLQAINNHEDFLSAYYVLENDIDCTMTNPADPDFDDSGLWQDESGFTPIGNYQNSFSGHFNGGGYSIVGLYIDRGADDQIGLFGEISEDGFVEYLGVEDVYMSGDQGVGALGAVVYGTIENSFSSGQVIGDNEVGGLVGGHEGWDTIRDSYSTASVEGYGNIGGLVGSNYGNIYDSYATGNVTGEYSVGGLIGFSGEDTTIDANYAEGDVTGVEGVGGLIGSTAPLTMIVSSRATGDVYGVGNENEGIGGLGGSLYMTYVEDSHASGNVDADTSYDVGGFVGFGVINAYQSFATGSVNGLARVGGYAGTLNCQSAEISQSFATGDVTGDEGVGGFAGGVSSCSVGDSYARGNVTGSDQIAGFASFVSEADIVSSYATGLVQSEGGTAGFIGGDVSDSTINDSFWDIETTGQSTSSAGTGKTTQQMRQIATYTSELGDGAWNFDAVWNIHSEANDAYPCLIWTAISCFESDAPEGDADLNGDNIPDSNQPNISGYTSPITGKLVVIDAGEDCELTTDDLQRESQLSIQDAAYDYDNGLFDFAGDCGDEGFTTTVKLYYYDVDITNLVGRKFNFNTNAYFAIPGAAITQETINGHSVAVLTYDITDGGILDLDETVDGQFIDPAGLARLVVGSPNTGLRRL